MQLIVRGTAIGVVVAVAVATCLAVAVILASEPNPLRAATNANAFVNLLIAALVVHVPVSVPLGVLGGALAGYQAGTDHTPRTRGQWTRRGGLVGTLIGTSGCMAYGALLDAPVMWFGILGAVGGIISGALIGAWCHRVDPLTRR